MGLKIKAKFGSKCEKCAKTWKEGEEIYWDKTLGSATCSDLECYKSKNGSAIEFPTGNKGGSYYKFPITKAPEILNMAQGMADAVVAQMVQDEKFKGLMETRDYLTLVESIFKTMSQSYKGE